MELADINSGYFYQVIEFASLTEAIHSDFKYQKLSDYFNKKVDNKM